MKLTTTIASATVSGVLGLAGVSVAGAAATGSSAPAPAASSTSTTVAAAPGTSNSSAPASGPRSKFAARRRHLRRRMAVIAARTIGIKPRALVRELRSGKTIAQVATEHGVSPAAVIGALEAATTQRIDAARAANKITAARAARMKQRAAVAIPRIVNDWHPRAHPAG